MRMYIRPASLWLAYTLTDPRGIQRYLPPQLDLASHALLDDEASLVPTPKLLFNAYEVNSQWMRGTRVDVLTCARHAHTGVLHLVLLDCFTNTMSWDPSNGVQRANAFVRRQTRPRAANGGKYHLCMQSRGDKFEVFGKLGRSRPINWKFAVQANRVCYFRSCSIPYAMQFNETSVALPVRDLTWVGVANTLWSGVRTRSPSHAFVHPHDMSFDVDVRDFGPHEAMES